MDDLALEACTQRKEREGEGEGMLLNNFTHGLALIFCCWPNSLLHQKKEKAESSEKTELAVHALVALSPCLLFDCLLVGLGCAVDRYLASTSAQRSLILH